MSVGILENVATLFELDEVDAAYSAMREYFRNASPEEIATVITCADMLYQRPKTGVVKLRDAWKRATDERTRATIAACGKGAATAKRAEHVTEPDRAPRWTATNKHEAPSEVRSEVRPEIQQQPRKRADHEPRAVRAYFDDRAGVDDEPAPRERPDGYALDYDRASIAPQRGTSCVSCFIERSSADFRTRQDDGLCEQCREDGRPGIAIQPDGNRADAVRARCAYLAEHYPQAARTLMRAYWRQSSDADRSVIEGWVQRHHTERVRIAPVPRPRRAVEPTQQRRDPVAA